MVLLVELETFNLSLDMCSNGTASSSLSLSNLVVADGAGLQLLGSSSVTTTPPGCPRATDQSDHVSSRNSSRTEEGLNSSSKHSSRVSSRTNTKDEEEKHTHDGSGSKNKVTVEDEQTADDASTLSDYSVGPAPLLQVTYHRNLLSSDLPTPLPPPEEAFSQSLHVEAQPLDAVISQAAVLQVLLFTDDLVLPSQGQQPSSSKSPRDGNASSTAHGVPEEDSWNPPPSFQPGTPGVTSHRASSSSNSTALSTSDNAVDVAASSVSRLTNLSFSLHLGKIGVSAADNTTGELIATLNLQNIDASMCTIPGRATANLSLGNAQLWHLSPDSANELLGRWDPSLLRQGDAYENSDSENSDSDGSEGHDGSGSNGEFDSDIGDLDSDGEQVERPPSRKFQGHSSSQAMNLDQPLASITACVETKPYRRSTENFDSPSLMAIAGVKVEPLRLVASAPFALAMQFYVSNGPLMAYFASKSQEETSTVNVQSSSLPWNASPPPRSDVEANQPWDPPRRNDVPYFGTSSFPLTETGGTSLSISARPNNFTADESGNRSHSEVMPPGKYALRVKLTVSLASPTLLLPIDLDSALTGGLLVDLGEVATTVELEGASCLNSNSSNSSSDERGANGNSGRTQDDALKSKPRGFLVPSPAPATSTSLPSMTSPQQSMPSMVVAKTSLHVQGALVRDVSSGGSSLLLPINVAVLVRLPLSAYVPQLAVDQPVARAVATALLGAGSCLNSGPTSAHEPSFDRASDGKDGRIPMFSSSAPENNTSSSHHISSADLPTEGVSPTTALLVVKVSPVVTCLSEATLTLALRAAAAVTAALPPPSPSSSPENVPGGVGGGGATDCTTGTAHI